MEKYIKPPIGICPHWIAQRDRIRELNEAIGRYLNHIENHTQTIGSTQFYELIAKWAKEMEYIASMEAELNKPNA